MGPTPVVTGILAKLQELFDIEVPRFQVGAYSALAFAALIDGDSRVVHDLQKGHHPLRFAIRPFDVRTQRADPCPVVAKAARKLGQQGVFLDGLINAIEVIGHGGQVAA